ncbi:putative carboxylesterase [Lophiotrema nucula]|uniref:Carboxylic ester hydrolase n=1 Tax=Lophiotrema nucula TaxID=690887 RepID=A0A6A5YG70_9PLEO|nr:putative carboxylesterase [Lophiotrema nucula]
MPEHAADITVVHDGLSPLAHTLNGTFLGLHSAKYSQDYFLGIPYALPPLGSLRFMPPAALNLTWAGMKRATEFGPQCIGYFDYEMDTPRSMNEDCLTLNIFRPHSNDPLSKLPVVIYIYGGAYIHGGSNDQRYNLTWIVAQSVAIGKPIIGVTLNFRSSVFGFMSSRQILEEGNTNIGLRDQRLAFQWIQENVESFGGDRTRVTIWGASSGAGNVGIHLTAYGGRDDHLFRAAIMSSGSPVTSSLGRHTISAQNAFEKLIRLAGCGNATDAFRCLQGLPIEELSAILTNSQDFGFSYVMALARPVLDNDLIRDLGSVQLETGRFLKIPIMNTITSNEGGGYTPEGLNTREDVKQFLGDWFDILPPSVTERLMALYLTRSSTETGEEDLGHFFMEASYILGDIEFVAPHRLTCDAFSHFQPTFCGRWDAIPYGADPRRGTTHAADLAPIFHNIPCTGFVICPFQGKPEAYSRLADLISTMIISFITELNPNSAIPTSWNVSTWENHKPGLSLDFVFSDYEPSRIETEAFRVDETEYIRSILAPVLVR